MQAQLNALSRKTIVLLIATLASGALVSTAVSAQPQSMLASKVIAGSLGA